MEAEQLGKKYRTLQLLQDRANDTYRYLLAASKVLLLLATIRSIYGMLKTDGLLQILYLNCAIANVVYLSATFRALGQAFEESRLVLLEQRSGRGSDKWARRLLRSCRSLRFEIAHLYFIDPPMSLTMGSFVLQNVANLLMVAE